jgi:hypothetical protein
MAVRYLKDIVDYLIINLPLTESIGYDFLHTLNKQELRIMNAFMQVTEIQPKIKLLALTINDLEFRLIKKTI